MPPNTPDRPSAFPWPPVLLATVVALALGFDHWVVPLPIPFAELLVARQAGWALLVAGFGLVIWAGLEFRNHRTSLRPDRGATALIVSGPFAFCRNPIYLGEAAALVGAALAFNRLSLLLVVPLFVIAIDRLAIRREEAHLERRFGADYLGYQAQVRRWI